MVAPKEETDYQIRKAGMKAPTGKIEIPNTVKPIGLKGRNIFMVAKNQNWKCQCVENTCLTEKNCIPTT
jgi:hypothetical protein